MDTRQPRRRVAVATLLLALVGAVAAPLPGWADAGPSSPPTGTGGAASSSEALDAEVRREGSVRVVVELAADFRPEGDLDAPDRAAQRSAFGRQRAALARDLAGTDHEVLHAYDSVPSVALRVGPAALQVLRESARVADVEVDEPFDLALADSTAYIEVEGLWDMLGRETAGQGYAVAVLDTGVDRAHPFVEGRIVDEACFSGGGDGDVRSICPNGEPSQTGPGAGVHCDVVVAACAHGTHVAGIAATVAPGAGIMPIQVFSETDDCTDEPPCLSAFRSDVLAGLEHVLDRSRSRPVAAANLSFGGGPDRSTSCDGDEVFKAMIDNLASEGVATVVATGNAGLRDAVNHPACISTAVSVGSTWDETDEVSEFSNNHSEMVDLLAPGQEIWSAYPDERVSKESGTSMAAPHVAGAWALMRHRLPGASVATILARLQEAAVPVADTREGAGGYTRPRLRLSPEALGFDDESDPQCVEAPFPDVGVDHPFCVAIDWVAQQGIASGYPDGSFGPTRLVTRQAMAAFLYAQAGSPDLEHPELADGHFEDVGADHPFVQAIAWMVEQGLAQGFSDGTFRPADAVSRQSVAAFLYRAAGAPPVDASGSDFVDVDPDHPFAEAISWMAAEDLSTGYDDGTFRPSRDVARQAAAAFLYRGR